MPSQLSRSRNAWVAKAKQAVGKALGMENATLYQQIGRMEAQISAMVKGFDEFRKETRDQLHILEMKIDSIDSTVTPLDAWQRGAKDLVEKLDKRTTKIETILKQSYGVMTLTIAIIGFVVTGFWWAITHWNDVATIIVGFFGGTLGKH